MSSRFSFRIIITNLFKQVKDSHWRKKHRMVLVGISISILALIYFLWPYPSSYLDIEKQSLSIFDRQGELLMELTPGHSGFIDPIPLDKFPESFVTLVLFSEDRLFYQHGGISLRSLFRALWQNIQAGKRVSGGSTITQQLVKYKKGRFRNNIFTKSLELLQAVKLNLHFSKHDILQYYLNHIYMGYRNKGFNRAARIYFGKGIADLDELEMAALIQLIKGPSLYDIYHKTLLLEERAHQLLQLAYQQGVIDQDHYELSLDQRLEVVAPQVFVTAPHFCFWALKRARALLPPGQTLAEIHTTLDADLYRTSLRISQDRIDHLRSQQASQSSVLILDNATGEVLVMLGSVDWYAADGQVNGVTMKRQPGSTMKAFTYALALETGKYHLSTIIPDVPTDFPAMVGKYIPRNYDERFHGPVRLAVALGSSYNVPAVYLTHKLGIRRYYAKLRQLGFDSLIRSPEYYGLGLTLGNADISLLELTRAYMSLANQGMWKDIRGVDHIITSQGKVIQAPASRKKRVYKAQTARLISHILEDFRYKTPAYGATSPLNFPWSVSVKTGTSKDFRDNTVEAFTGELTIGIWTGNFSGKSMKNLPSARGSGLILRDLLLELYNQGYNHPSAYPEGDESWITLEICPLSGKLAGPYCQAIEEVFLPAKRPMEICDWHQKQGILMPPLYREWGRLNLESKMIETQEDGALQILSPSHNDIFQIDSHMDRQHQAIRLSAQGPEPIIWSLDDKVLGEGRELLWVLEPGTFWIEARHGEESRRVKVIVVEE